ncbi:AraC family transcriptional regulator ligand-binding domain-containing protein [Acinetobacter puyangensis]|uniref:AraC family transcriptional regulator ligand-binding domain-containing protein n=1 Tax=Acinetobacter puyangensis TaxID=1096779 RepID=UPI003A4D418E
MKRFYHIKSLNSGLIELLEVFIDQHNLNIPKQLHYYDVNERVSFIEWFSLLEEIAQKYKGPAIELEIAQCAQFSHFGVLGYLGQSCQNISEVIQVFVKYQRLCYDFLQPIVSVEGSDIRISWESNFDIMSSSLANTTMIAILFNVVSQFVFPQKIKLNKVYLSSKNQKLQRFMKVSLAVPLSLKKIKYVCFFLKVF